MDLDGGVCLALGLLQSSTSAFALGVSCLFGSCFALGVSCLFGSCLGYCAAVLSTTAFASRVGRRLGGFSGFRAAALRRTCPASPGDLLLGALG